jgi:VWFA-related protein
LDTNDLDSSTDFFFDVNAVAVQSENVLFDMYETPSPVSVVLAIDTSSSESGVLEDIKSAAISFINQLDDVDEAAICSFNSSIEFEPVADSAFYDLATHRQNLIDHINTLTQDTNTRFYNAIYESADRAANGITTNKHLIVVLSDGVDTASNRTLNEAITYAEDRGVAIFTIYYRDPDYEQGDYGNPNVLEQLADGTGGQDYDGMTGGLDSVYSKIVGTIRNMFVFEITVPGCTPGPASLDVLVDTGTLYGMDSSTLMFP